MKSIALFIADQLIYGVIVILIAMAFFSHSIVVDIQLHDTYYVVPVSFILIPPAVYFSLQVLIYKIISRKGSSRVFSFRTSYSIFSSIFVTGFLYYIFLPSISRRYYTFTEYDANSMVRIFIFLLLTFFIGQICFVISLFKREK